MHWVSENKHPFNIVSDRGFYLVDEDRKAILLDTLANNSFEIH